MHLKKAMPKVPCCWFRFTLTIAISYLVVATPAAAVASDVLPPMIPADSIPGCPSMCGDVHIPYPFGIGVDCAWSGVDEYFSLTCNHSFNPPRPYWANVEVIDISVEAGEMRVFSPVSYICYNSSKTTERHGVSTWVLDYTKSPLLISSTRNEFTAIGCNTLALLEGREDWSYYTGCISTCVSLDAAARDGDQCSGLGCCQTSISGNLSTVNVYWRNGNTTRVNRAWRYSPCSYAFVAEKGWYKFSRRDLVRDGNNDSFSRRAGERTIPLVLDWAIRKGFCRPTLKDGEAAAKPRASACVSAHSYCVEAPQGDGYLCKCSKGYTGNPYVTGPGECTNINECELRKSNPTKYETLYPCHSGGTCHDTEGDYKCTCKFGRRGDGKSDKGCQPIFPAYAIAILVVSTVAILACFAALELKRRMRRRFFDQNGGKILKNMGITIFTEAQLRKITDDYKEAIGQGAFGKVYKGIIDGNQPVAVKRASVVGGKALQQDEFVNEITFQFRISHRNLVCLVGCCLETDIPMLVFEFVPKGSLYNLLHGTNAPQLSLKQLLDIAIGSAEGIAYMHGNQKHVHGDIKSANILLDDDLMPKVSDFGSSKLMSKSYVRSVACDTNYIDPIYFQTNCFTEKSDIYSFGVVLLELITRKMAKYNDGKNCLPIDFKKSWKNIGNGQNMYDVGILFVGDAQSLMECLDRVGALAVQCLMEDTDERPTMAYVVEELNQVMAMVRGGSSSDTS